MHLVFLIHVLVNENSIETYELLIENLIYFGDWFLDMLGSLIVVLYRRR